MSYKIYAGTGYTAYDMEDKVCIYAPGSALETTKLISPTLTREFGKAGSLEFTIPLGNVAHSALQKLKTVISVEQDGKEIWQGRVMNHEQDFLLRQKVYCEGELAYLNDTDVPPYTAKDVTIRQFLDFLCDNHTKLTDEYKQFYIGNVTVEEQRRYVPVAEKCYMELDYAASSPDADGDYRQDWGLYSKNENRLIEGFSTVFSDYEDVQTPPEKSWTLNEIKTREDYLIWRTGDNQFTLRRNAVSQGSKTYDAEQTIVNPSITTPIETYKFDATIKVTKKDTESKTYSIKTEKDGTVNVDAFSDVIMLAAVDFRNRQISLLTLSRDTMCEFQRLNPDGSERDWATGQLALTFSYGDGALKSCEITKNAVSQALSDLPIQSCSALYLDGLRRLTDAVGGVTVTVLEDLSYGYASMQVGAEVTLDGAMAERYIRARERTEEGNLKRMERQKQFFTALMKKVLASVKERPASILDLYGKISSDVVTDLETGDILYLATEASGMRIDTNIRNVPGTVTSDENGFVQYDLDEAGLLELLLDVYYEAEE